MLHSSRCTFFQICDPSGAESTHCCSSACLEHPSWHTQSQVRQKTGHKSPLSCNWKKARRASQHLVTKLGRFSVECHKNRNQNNHPNQSQNTQKSKEPIKAWSKYMQLMPDPGKCVKARRHWLRLRGYQIWFWNNDKVKKSPKLVTFRHLNDPLDKEYNLTGNQPLY